MLKRHHIPKGVYARTDARSGRPGGRGGAGKKHETKLQAILSIDLRVSRVLEEKPEGVATMHVFNVFKQTRRRSFTVPSAWNRLAAEVAVVARACRHQKTSFSALEHWGDDLKFITKY